jgi:hypothetical protein
MSLSVSLLSSFRFPLPLTPHSYVPFSILSVGLTYQNIFNVNITRNHGRPDFLSLPLSHFFEMKTQKNLNCVCVWVCGNVCVEKGGLPGLCMCVHVYCVVHNMIIRKHIKLVHSSAENIPPIFSVI